MENGQGERTIRTPAGSPTPSNGTTRCSSSRVSAFPSVFVWSSIRRDELLKRQSTSYSTPPTNTHYFTATPQRSQNDQRKQCPSRQTESFRRATPSLTRNQPRVDQLLQRWFLISYLDLHQRTRQALMGSLLIDRRLLKTLPNPNPTTPSFQPTWMLQTARLYLRQGL